MAWAYWALLAALFVYRRCEGLLNNYKSGLAAMGTAKVRFIWQLMEALRQL